MEHREPPLGVARRIHSKKSTAWSREVGSAVVGSRERRVRKWYDVKSDCISFVASSSSYVSAGRRFTQASLTPL